MSAISPTLVSSIGWTLLQFVWQGMLIGCATAIALAAMRNAPPQQRYGVACAALLACLAWPAIEFYQRMHGADGAVMNTITGSLSSDAPLPGSAGGIAAGLIALMQRKLAWIVSFWALCAAMLALRLALGLAWVGRLGRMTVAANSTQWQARVTTMASQFGITRAVRLRVAENLASPMTAGWWRPVIVLPAALLSGMPPDLLDALLAHEMAHIQRCDYLLNLIQNMIEIVLFYHPAVWWISGQIRIEREQIADDLAARQLGEPRRLALALSELERFQFSTHHLAIAANGGHLMLRIKRLIRPDTQTLNWKASIPITALAAACLALYGCAASAPHETKADVRPDTSAMVDSTSSKPDVLPDTIAMVDFASCKRPEWPAEALRNKQTGTVTLKFQIGEAGNVMDANIVRSSGVLALDEAARDGIKVCTFKPATRNGKAVAEWTHIQYVWKHE